ncbi:hypothetical protein [uncultured Piscinibacter sp.]|uniref:hypothetical protein n=1 Tax=uncultured Piscinibacter sp. TaxID=1131835 RepID=UPI00262C284E|nr:hypothetical protein [uncultured Piscinibacter sp.]
MGYSHYLDRRVDLTDEQWIALQAAAVGILAACEARGISIAGPDGDGEPIVGPFEIAFNGSSAVDGAYESCVVTRMATGPGWTKTGFCQVRPYDLAVTAVYLAAATIAPDASALDSDGDLDGADWAPARELVAALGVGRVGELSPRWPVNWAPLLDAADVLAPRAVQLSAGDAPTWAVPSGANPGHGYIVTGPASAPVDRLDVARYICNCPWGRPQGPSGRPGVGCKHALAVIARRLDGQRERVKGAA